MANKSLFASLTSRLPRANAAKEARGRAYKFEPKHALAQVVATGNRGARSLEKVGDDLVDLGFRLAKRSKE